MERKKTCPECLRERPISMFIVTTTEVRTCSDCWDEPSENLFDSYASSKVPLYEETEAKFCPDCLHWRGQ